MVQPHHLVQIYSLYCCTMSLMITQLRTACRMKPRFKDVSFNIPRYIARFRIVPAPVRSSSAPTLPCHHLACLACQSMLLFSLRTQNFWKGSDDRCVGEIACVGRLMPPTVTTSELLSRPEIPSLICTALRKFVQCSSIRIDYGRGAREYC